MAKPSPAMGGRPARGAGDVTVGQALRLGIHVRGWDSDLLGLRLFFDRLEAGRERSISLSPGDSW